MQESKMPKAIKEVPEDAIKKRELSTLLQGLKGVGELQDKKFSLAILKNFKRINSELKDLHEIRDKHSDNVKLYIELIDALKLEYARKDNAGKVITVNQPDGSVTINIKDEVKYLSALEKLKEANPEDAAEYEKDQKDYEALLDTPASFEIYKIDYDEVVPENISPSQLGGIDPFVIYPED
jgi:hypothetical protein